MTSLMLLKAADTSSNNEVGANGGGILDNMLNLELMPLLEGIDSFFGFQLAHALVDPLLEAIPEPPLQVVRNPNR